MKNEEKAQQIDSKDKGDKQKATTADPVPVAEVANDSSKKRSEAGIQIKVRDDKQEEQSQE